MIAEPLPTWLSDLCPRFQESRVFDGLDATHPLPNHCLVNEYLAGQGIMVIMALLDDTWVDRIKRIRLPP